MRTIPLTQGQVTWVDDADYSDVIQFTWWALKRKHGFHAMGWVNGRKIYLHCYLLGVLGCGVVDHEDGNGLNNTRDNLRYCAKRQNLLAFRVKRTDTSSQFVGVSLRKDTRRWSAYIHTHGKKTNLGCFDSEMEAAEAYNAAAIARDPKFHHLNKV